MTRLPRHNLRRRPRQPNWLLLLALLAGSGVVAQGVRQRIRARAARAPEGTAGRTIQGLRDGWGDIFLRRYSADIIAASERPQVLMQQIMADVNAFAPQLLMTFERTRGEEGALGVGDEFHINITGPFNGPVRVVACDDTSFTLATLRGHLESGQITFRFAPHPSEEGVLRFEISSFARSSTPDVYLTYNILKLSQLAQQQAWVQFCEAVVKASGGELLTPVEVATQTAPYVARVPQRDDDSWVRYRDYIQRYNEAAINFEEGPVASFTRDMGWNLDTYEAILPPEPPGPPVEGGSFSYAQQVIERYEFPEPRIVHGYFDVDGPLQNRVIVIEARFLWVFLFLFGLRINHLVDEERDDPKLGKVNVWGFSYRTLEGHFEMGEMWFEAWKIQRSGEVSFRIHAYSRRAPIRNPLFRLGFYLFGRQVQVRYARLAIQRLQALVVQRINTSLTT